MSGDENICTICAWRATCQKKFLVSGKDMRCSDYVKDVSIKSGTGDEEKDSGKVDSEKK